MENPKDWKAKAGLQSRQICAAGDSSGITSKPPSEQPVLGNPHLAGSFHNAFHMDSIWLAGHSFPDQRTFLKISFLLS